MDSSTEYLNNNQYKLKRLLIRLLIVLFTVSISVAIIPSGILILQGFFGEVKIAVVEERETAQEQQDIQRTINLKENIRIFNIWLLIIITILLLRFIIHSSKAPPHQTLVSIRVRMDD
ncbi:hypothetical protein [[Clostridium] fimetarium]|uniref:Uncharacterized protein n=1 Tax=[Clostridium] fimetarium TaxID=99656 RepID=A0A1I0Q6Q8_9FIRM|nr:hypothetical protein [[Clostridium] fimetarium]SEW22632.1 hypothetical protein SAMN05421659_10741 [[Clostridium] fimetarium]